MTELDRVRELELSDTIQLEGVQSRAFWIIQFALCSLWLVSGLRDVRSGTADWMDWLQVIVSVCGLCTFVLILCLRRLYGPPRIEFTSEGIRTKPNDFARQSFFVWADIDHIDMSRSQVTVTSGSKAVRLPLTSYAMVGAVKSRLGILAQDEGVDVRGYW